VFSDGDLCELTQILGVRRTRGVTVRKIQGVGYGTFVLSVENDIAFRSRCERIFRHFGSS
jgi:hypothetical protein